MPRAPAGPTISTENKTQNSAHGVLALAHCTGRAACLQQGRSSEERAVLRLAGVCDELSEGKHSCRQGGRGQQESHIALHAEG